MSDTQSVASSTATAPRRPAQPDFTVPQSPLSSAGDMASPVLPRPPLAPRFTPAPTATRRAAGKEPLDDADPALPATALPTAWGGLAPDRSPASAVSGLSQSAPSASVGSTLYESASSPATASALPSESTPSAARPSSAPDKCAAPDASSAAPTWSTPSAPEPSVESRSRSSRDSQVGEGVVEGSPPRPFSGGAPRLKLQAVDQPPVSSDVARLPCAVYPHAGWACTLVAIYLCPGHPRAYQMPPGCLDEDGIVSPRTREASLQLKVVAPKPHSLLPPRLESHYPAENALGISPQPDLPSKLVSDLASGQAGPVAHSISAQPLPSDIIASDSDLVGAVVPHLGIQPQPGLPTQIVSDLHAQAAPPHLGIQPQPGLPTQI
eukprot:gene11574-2104_t